MAVSQHLFMDISSDSVCGVLLAVDKKVRKVENSLSIPCDGQEGMPDALEELLAGLSVSGIPCSLSMTPEFFFFRSLTIPFSDRRQVRSVLQFELQDSVVLAEDEYLHESILYDVTPDMTGVLAVLLVKEKLKVLLSIFQKYSLDPEILTISGLATIVNFLRSNGDGNTTFKVVDIGVRYAALYLVKDGSVRLIRSIPYDSGATAGMKIEGSKVVAGNRCALDEVLTGLASTVNNTIAAWREGGSDFEDASLYITGAASSLDEVSRMVKILPGAEIVPAGWYHFSDLDRSGMEDARLPDTLFGNCLALACCVAGGRDLLNFRRKGHARSYQSKKIAWLVRNGLLLAGLLLIVTVAGLAVEYQKVKGKRDRLASDVKRIYRETIPEETRIVDPVQQLGVKVRDLKNMTLAAGASGTADLDTVVLLKEISERIPKSLQVKFERFIYDRETARIRGTTDNFNTVDQMKRHLDESPFFREVIIVSANVAAKGTGIRFELKLQL